MSVIERLEAPGCGCDARDLPGRLVSIDAALARIDAAAHPVAGTERLALDAALGRILAEPVTARAAVPPFDNAAMDGYSLATAGLAGDGPWVLPLCGRVAAGQGDAGPVAPGDAVRIFTGAPLPAGADAVVMQEAVQRHGARITLSARPRPGQHVRRAGEDMAAGATVLQAGRRIGPCEIAAAAAAGHGTLTVRRRLRVALLATGDELSTPGDTRAAAAIWDVNSPMLAAAMAGPGIEIVARDRVADSVAAIEARLARLARDADLVVSTGGVSVGSADHAKPAFRALGGALSFSGVAIKPGKPVSFGRLGDALWLGLPGNPLSAFVTWTLFGARIAARLCGRTAPTLRRRLVVTGAALCHRPGRCELRLARIDGSDGAGRDVVACPGATHSGRVSGMPAADGLVLIPGDVDSIPEGGLVEFLPFPEGCGAPQ